MLQAGFARVDITPPLGIEMSGHYEHRFADGTLDPLYLNVLALSDENGALLLMAVDYLGIKQDHVLALQSVISQRTGVDAERIFITALHPHSAPCLIHPKPHDTPDRPIRDEAFLDVLYRRFADAAQRCAITEFLSSGFIKRGVHFGVDNAWLNTVDRDV